MMFSYLIFVALTSHQPIAVLDISFMQFPAIFEVHLCYAALEDCCFFFIFMYIRTVLLSVSGLINRHLPIWLDCFSIQPHLNNCHQHSLDNCTSRRDGLLANLIKTTLKGYLKHKSPLFVILIHAFLFATQLGTGINEAPRVGLYPS